jgi:hypothetical protein
VWAGERRPLTGLPSEGLLLDDAAASAHGRIVKTYGGGNIYDQAFAACTSRPSMARAQKADS